MPSEAEQVIRLQKATLRSIERRIRDIVGPPPAELRRYRSAYLQATSAYRAVSTRQALTAAVSGADIVFCGDYHTLDQAQRVHLRLLRDQVSTGRPVMLGVEVIPASEQDRLDDYMKGSIDERTFLESIHYDEIWGFPWKHYKPLFDFARLHGIPLFGLNTPPASEGKTPTLAERDRFVASRVAEISRRFPGRLLFVTFGDLHLAPGHLPSKTRSALQGCKRKILVIFQNSESIYWKLASEGLADKVDVVLVDDDVYCIIGAPPWVKLQSYLDWLEDCDRMLSGDAGGDGLRCGYEDEVFSIAVEIAAFLDLPTLGLDSFELKGISDLSELRRLYPRLPRLLEHNNCLYFPDRRLIFLAVSDVNHAAEGAAELLHHTCSRYVEAADGASRDDFYRRVMRRALAHFGSMVLNHKRKCMYFRDHHLLVNELARRRLPPEEAERRSISRMVLRHQAAEDEYIWGLKKRLNLPSVYAFDFETGGAVSRAVGAIQGDKFYRGLVQGILSRKELAELFADPLDPPGRAFDTYIRWRTILKQVFKMFTSKEQFF